MNTIDQQLKEAMKSPLTPEEIAAKKAEDLKLRRAKFEGMSNKEVEQYFTKLGEDWKNNAELMKIMEFCNKAKEDGLAATDVLPTNFLERVMPLEKPLMDMQFCFTLPSPERLAEWDYALEEMKGLLLELSDFIKFGKEMA